MITIPICERLDIGSRRTPFLQKLPFRHISTYELEQNRTLRRPPIGHRVKVQVSIDIASIRRAAKLPLEEPSLHRATFSKGCNSPFFRISHLGGDELMRFLDRKCSDQPTLTPAHNHGPRHLDTGASNSRNRIRNCRQRLF